MADIKDDPQFEDVIKILKGLQRVDAAPGFEMNLRRRLNSEKYPAKESWINKILSPARLIPSAALAAAAVLFFFFFNIEAPQFDDPLSMEPQVREDVLSGESADKYVSDRVENRETQGLQAASNVNYIMKSGLNFRQVNLSQEEKEKLQELKNRFKQWLHSNPQK